MVETTSVREEKTKLSAKDRLCLIQTINVLPLTQFDELVFALDPPKGIIAPNAAQEARGKELLGWLEGSTGPGLAAAMELLRRLKGFSSPGLAAADEVLQVLIPKTTKKAPQPMAFAISGKVGELSPSEIEAIVELLRQKTGDDSISLAFSKEGSSKLILNGSPEGLAKLQEMFEAGELEQLDIPPIEAIASVDTNTHDARKARLIQALRLRDRSSVNLASELAHASELARDIAIAITIASDCALARARALALARDIDRASNLAHARASDRARAIASARARDIDLALALDLAHEVALDLARDLDRTSDLASASTIASDLASDLDRASASALDHASNLDLREADLRGANLRDINLTGVDLTGADLTHVDVTGTIFGNNPGLTEADKHDLQSRGAIILASPSFGG